MDKDLIPVQEDGISIPTDLEVRIYTIRGQKVMIDSDLAELYGVETSALNRQVKRNIERFPADFMMQLNESEFRALICQIGTSNSGRGGRRKLPYVFTELGVSMLSSVLNTERAIKINIEIMRAFVKMRAITAIHGEFSLRLAELEKTVKTQGGSINFILDLVDRELKKKRIGFKPE
ncbi:MAG: ORF6N domain-containing protein [Candidatus Riflebacteria bacterium]|nr:ORF6N domain-containing protein [Candidatus Riflebacteria bacterium]